MSVAVLRPIAPAPESRAGLTLGMAQLSPFGLSEQWLLRDCGDRHWGLIAEAAGSGMAFHSADGTPVYAAFCATSVALATAPKLGSQAEVQSRLFDVAPHRIGSVHHITGPSGKLATVRMISCFLSHDGSGSNRRLFRNTLAGLDDLPPPPADLVGLLDRSRVLARMARATQGDETLLQYTPLPALDFNAVGLLYFPVFSKIAEMAAQTTPLQHRTVVHLGNIDPGETVTVSRAGPQLLLQAGDRTIGITESG